MKNLSILILINLFSIQSIFSMKNSTLYTQENQIRQRLKNQRNEFLTMLHNGYFNIQYELERIDQHFNYYKKTLEIEKEVCLLRIKNSHGIDDMHWKRILNLTKLMHGTIKNAINESHSNLFQETKLSDSHKILLQNQLKNYDFDLNKINLTYTISIDQNAGLNIQWLKYVKQNAPDTLTNDFTIKKGYDNPKIFLSIAHLNKRILIITAWLFAHMQYDNGVFTFLVTQASNQLCSMDQLEKSIEFINLKEIYIKQAEIYPSLDNYQSCKWILKNALQDNLFKTKQFEQLYKIKNLWKMRNALQKLSIQANI